MENRDLTSRGRHFAELESLIIAKERTLRRAVWKIPEYDMWVRLKSAERDARRRGQLAESARLAEIRRSRGIRPFRVAQTGASDAARLEALQIEMGELKRANTTLLASSIFSRELDCGSLVPVPHLRPSTTACRAPDLSTASAR